MDIFPREPRPPPPPFSAPHHRAAGRRDFSDSLLESPFTRSPSPPRKRIACLVAQSCPTLCDPMDCSPPGIFVHGDSPGRNTGVGCHALLQGIFPTQGLNPGLTLPADSLPAEPPGKRKDYWSPECGGLSSYANCHSLVPVSHYSHLRHRLFFLHAPRPAQPCQDPRETRCWPLCCKSTLRHRRQTSLGPMEGESVGCGQSASRPSLHP